MHNLSSTDIKSFVIEYLEKKVDDVIFKGLHIDDDSFDFYKAGIMDSLGLVDLISEIETTFQVKVDFEEMDPEKFTIIGSFSDYVAKNAIANEQ